MIQIICSIYFLAAFWKRARANDRPPWLWAIGGAASFVAISLLLPVALRYSAMRVGLTGDTLMVASVFGLFVGLAVGFLITDVWILKGLLPAHPKSGTRAGAGS